MSFPRRDVPKALMGSIARTGITLLPSECGAAVMDLFREEETVNLVCVVDHDGSPLGLIDRQHFLSLMSSPFSYALYHRRPITLLMDENPIIVDARMPIPVFTQKILQGVIHNIHNGFVVVDRGVYVGTATPFDLFQASYLHSARISVVLEEKTQTLSDIFEDISNTTKSINTGARSLQDESDRLSERNRIQNRNLEKSDDKIKVIINNTESECAKIAKSHGYIKAATKDIENSCVKINDTIEDFKDISKISSDIGGILDIMSDISFQINILGINASIEAAHAGVYGAGFSVVAQEVRNLADVTSSSLETIRSLIGDSKTTIGNCLETMNKNSDALLEITKKVDNISLLFEEFEAFAQNQKNDILSLNAIMDDVRCSTHNNNETVGRANDICGVLFSNVSDLARLTQQI
ncbi:methyl-accepting chemotaxis protein [Acetobacter sp.]|uniref:methyl-accepting chemotaxis protein n=2 Tax=Acetobacter sp. TaxID=440 RepID=UPI0039E828C7